MKSVVRREFDIAMLGHEMHFADLCHRYLKQPRRHGGDRRLVEAEMAARLAKIWRSTCGVMSAGRSPSLAILNHIFRYPTIGFSPDRLVNTTSPFLGWALITAQAASDKGRSDAPVLVSASRAVRRGRSTSDHRRPSTSPRRHGSGTVRDRCPFGPQIGLSIPARYQRTQTGRLATDKYLHTTEDCTMPQIVEPTPEDAQREIIKLALDEIATEVGTALRDAHLDFPVYITVRTLDAQ